MKKNLLILTALLIANAAAVRGEGEDNPAGGGNDGRMTEAEWQARNEALHAKSSHADLIKRVTTLERQNETLKANQTPKDGRVLTAEESKAYDAYVALGKPDEVKTKLDQGVKDSTDLTDLRFKDSLNTAARDSGFKATVLGDRIKADGLTVLPSREVEREGKKVQVAYVKDAQGAEHELGAYAKQHWDDYLSALNAGSGGNTGTSYARQDASGGSSGGGAGGSSSGSGNSNQGGGSWLQELIKPKEGSGYVDPLQPGSK
ncbi:hypothetical protein GO986_18725 [Deinococcus sp. HMF7620]|uniref:Uncharacterized protein n=1 Tax=Deinococcus arboris TaxID=2682977 RepID=A0A7C9LPE3_9DEIO|nr:hypothetical protein [Deinococcus arboris]MVN88777.1 hypothetical protein [Deinococcus arboris]